MKKARRDASGFLLVSALTDKQKSGRARWWYADNDCDHHPRDNNEYHTRTSCGVVRVNLAH